MARFKKLPTKTHEDKLIYGDGIVDSIVYIAISELPYTELHSNVSEKKKNRSESIRVLFDKEGVVVDVDVNIHFSQSVSDMAFKIQETIRHSIESMTEYHVANVNVNVRNVLFDNNTVNKQSSDNVQNTDITVKNDMVSNTEAKALPKKSNSTDEAKKTKEKKATNTVKTKTTNINTTNKNNSKKSVAKKESK